MRQLKITQRITNRDSNTLEKYFNDVSGIEMLSPEEEVILAQKIKQGDEQALEKLVKGNLRFVISVAKQYQYSQIPLNDLINEGNIGLIKAAQKFDETKGFKFISYAVWWIRQSIMQYANKHARFIRLPANKIAMMSKINQADAMWEQHHERPATKEELAELMDRPLKHIESALKSRAKFSSVDKPFKDGELGCLLDILENKEADKVEDQLAHDQSLRYDIKRLLSVLNEREQEVIKLSFGLCGSQALVLEDIGNKLGISRERTRQLKDLALNKLIANPANKLLKSYLG